MSLLASESGPCTSLLITTAMWTENQYQGGGELWELINTLAPRGLDISWGAESMVSYSKSTNDGGGALLKQGLISSCGFVAQDEIFNGPHAEKKSSRSTNPRSSGLF